MTLTYYETDFTRKLIYNKFILIKDKTTLAKKFIIAVYQLYYYEHPPEDPPE